MIATALHVSIMRTNELKGVKLASARDHDKVAAGDAIRTEPEAGTAVAPGSRWCWPHPVVTVPAASCMVSITSSRCLIN